MGLPRLVYYSMVNSPRSGCERQWTQSIRSLRRHNATIHVALFLFNGVSGALRREASRWCVTIHELGDYRTYLQRLHARGSVLALYPTFHKFLSLAHAPLENVAQVLYVDCDTFFFRDVDRLFDLSLRGDWYAREEPWSRASHYGYDPTYLDEPTLARTAVTEDARPIVPFNTGVCLLNNHVWSRLDPIRVTFLDLAWRLLCGRALWAPQDVEQHPEIRAAASSAMDVVDRSRALPYPSTNPWIVEQIALWLALGRLPELSLELWARAQVVQGAEFCEKSTLERCVLAHYYSTYEAEFFNTVPALGE